MGWVVSPRFWSGILKGGRDTAVLVSVEGEATGRYCNVPVDIGCVTHIKKFGAKKDIRYWKC